MTCSDIEHNFSANRGRVQGPRRDPDLQRDDLQHLRHRRRVHHPGQEVPPRVRSGGARRHQDPQVDLFSVLPASLVPLHNPERSPGLWSHREPLGLRV